MTSCKSYFIKYEILTITSLYILELCLLVKKNSHLFPQYSRPENLRPKKKLAISCSKLEFVNCGPHSMAVKIFNLIPEAIKSQPTLHKFKSTLNKYLVQKAFYSLKEFFTAVENNQPA